MADDKRNQIIDKLDRFLLGASFVSRVAEEHVHGKSSEPVCKKYLEKFLETQPTFGEYVKLSERKSWEEEVKKLWSKANEI